MRHIIYIAILCLLLLIFSWPLSKYLHFVFISEFEQKSNIHKNSVYKFLFKKNKKNDENQYYYTDYIKSLMGCTFISGIFTLLILHFQGDLPFNSQGVDNIPWPLALEITISYLTQTDWQSFLPEKQLSDLSQMAALTLQEFLAPAVAFAACLCLIRGLTNEDKVFPDTFYKDILKFIVFIFLPLNIIFAVLFLSQGVGPIAYNVATKLLGSNGGGYFSDSSINLLDNPSSYSNFFQTLAILILPSSIVLFFGHAVGNIRHGLNLWGLCCFLFILSTLLCVGFFSPHDLQNISSNTQPFRFFPPLGTCSFSVASAGTGCGVINSVIGSFPPLSYLVFILHILMGGFIFGATGGGLSNIILYVILSFFMGSLMVGQTPHYFGKPIRFREMKLLAVSLLFPAILKIFLIAIWSRTSTVQNNSHVFSEIFFNWASIVQGNGAPFGDNPFNSDSAHFLLSIVMLASRFVPIICIIIMGYNLRGEKRKNQDSQVVPLNGLVFQTLLLGTVLLFCCLSFFPYLTLGPILEYLKS